MKLIVKHKLPAGIELWGKESSLTAGVIKVLYDQAGIGELTNKRVAQLLKTIDRTPEELMAYAGVFDKAKFKEMWENQRWPAPVALHVIKLEAFVYGSLLPDPQDNAGGVLLARRFARSFDDG